jgi:hypothetical protein
MASLRLGSLNEQEYLLALRQHFVNVCPYPLGSCLAVLTVNNEQIKQVSDFFQGLFTQQTLNHTDCHPNRVFILLDFAEDSGPAAWQGL